MTDTNRLYDIYQEIKELISEAETLVRGTSEEGRAKSYWLAHIKCALDHDHTYLGRDMCTMEESIEALEEKETEDA